MQSAVDLYAREISLVWVSFKANSTGVPGKLAQATTAEWEGLRIGLDPDLDEIPFKIKLWRSNLVPFSTADV